MIVASLLQVDSDKLEDRKQQPFKFAKYLPQEPPVVKIEMSPSPPPAVVPKLSPVSPAQGNIALEDLPPLPEQQWETPTRLDVGISLAADLLVKRRITEN
jgi:hypothetical protein